MLQGFLVDVCETQVPKKALEIFTYGECGEGHSQAPSHKTLTSWARFVACSPLTAR